MKINKSKNKNFRKRSKTKIIRRTKKTKRNKRNKRTKKKRTIKKRKEKIIKNVMMGGSTASSAPTSQDTTYSTPTEVGKHHIIFRHMGKRGPNSFDGVLKVIGSELQNQEVGQQLKPSEIAVIAPGNPENYYKGGSLFGLFRTKFGHHFAEDCRKMPLVSRGNMNVVGSTKGGKINMSDFQLALGDAELEREGWSTPGVGTVGLDYRYDNTRLFTGDARMVCNPNYEHCHNIINVSGPNARDDEHNNFLGGEGKKKYLELASSCLRHSLILAHCKGIKLVVCTFIGCGVYNQKRGGGQICAVPEILFRLYEEAVKFCNLLTRLNPKFMINICFMGDSSEAEGFDVFKQRLSDKLKTTTYNETLETKILGKITTLNSLIEGNSELTKEQWEHIEYLYRGLNEGFVRGCIEKGYSLNRLMILYGLEYCCPAIKEDFKSKYSDWGGNLSDAIPQELSVEDSPQGRIFKEASVTIPKDEWTSPVEVRYFYEKEGKREDDLYANLAMEDSYLDKPDVLRLEAGNPQRHDKEYSTYYVGNIDPITKFEIIEGKEGYIIEQYKLLKTLQETAEHYGCGHYVVKVYLGISRRPEKAGTTDATTREEKKVILKHCDHLPLLVSSFNEPTTGGGAGVGGRGAGETIHAFAKVGFTKKVEMDLRLTLRGYQFDCQHQMYLQDVLNNNYLSAAELRILTYELIYAVAFVHQCGVFIGEGINPRTIMLTLVETGNSSNPTKSSVMITDFSYAIKMDGGDGRKYRLRDWKRVCAILEELKRCLFDKTDDRIQFLDDIIKNLKGNWYSWGGVFVLGQTDGYTGSSELMTAMNEFLRGVPVESPGLADSGKLPL